MLALRRSPAQGGGVVHRLKALLMLAIVGFVLPVAGAPQRFCVKAFMVLAPGQDCSACQPTGEPDCGCHGAGGDEEPPGCVIGAKVLPDGVSPDAVACPQVPAATQPPASLVAGEILVGSGGHSRMADRGPPPGRPLYLLQRALLL
jgi:hypothetical protein